MDPTFWDSPDDWPIDPPNFIFLARALQRIGRARYGAEKWDYEAPSASDDDSDRANEAWEEFVDAAEARIDEMYAAVRREIAQQCLAGYLITAARPKVGGEMINLSQSDWNAEHIEKRFERCQIAMNNRFGRDDFASFGHWIFIEHNSLQTYLAGLKPPETPPSGVGSLQVATIATIKQKWPTGIPVGLKAKDRDRQIGSAMVQRGSSEPSPAVIRRALRHIRAERV